MVTVARVPLLVFITLIIAAVGYHPYGQKEERKIVPANHLILSYETNKRTNWEPNYNQNIKK